MASTVKNRPTGTVTLPARPSMPSVMLTALTVPTMTNAANTMYTHQLMTICVLNNGT